MRSSRVQQAFVCIIASLWGREGAFAKSLLGSAAGTEASPRERCRSWNKKIHYLALPSDEIVFDRRNRPAVASGERSYFAFQRNISPSDRRLLPATLSWRGGALPDVQAYVAGDKTRSWFVLLLAILIDTMSAALMKAAQDEGSRSKLTISYAAYFVSLYGFSLSLTNLDVSIAYAVWAAMGTAIVSAFGIILFNESYDVVKLVCLLMIVAGVVGLNLRESH